MGSGEALLIPDLLRTEKEDTAMGISDDQNSNIESFWKFLDPWGPMDKGRVWLYLIMTRIVHSNNSVVKIKPGNDLTQPWISSFPEPTSLQ